MKTKVLVISILGALLPGLATAAETRAENWQFRATLYGYFPSIEGTTRFATPVSDMEADALIENTEFAAMGSCEVQKGRFGGFTDVIYMDVGDSIDDATSLGQGSIPLPPGVTADASLDERAWAWTIAGTYRAVSTARTTLDLFAGARLLDAEADLALALNVGPPLAGQASRDNWDGIVGVKGRLLFGDEGRWFVPYYLDIGTGDSDMTAQLARGLGYAFGRAEVFGAWRYLDYDLGADAGIKDLQFSGPAIGLLALLSLRHRALLTQLRCYTEQST